MSFSFVALLNSSIAASWLVLAVILARFLLKKAPKAIHCALWALVAIRLLCPFTIESEFSLIPSAQTVSPEYLTQNAALSSDPVVLDVVENPLYPEEVDLPLDAKSSRVSWADMNWHGFIWPAGMALMGLYVLISYLRLRKKVSVSIPIARDIRICDYIDSPFILGILRPRIYLPSNMEQETLDHVLAHEYAHLARKDHWWKPLGFFLLTVHWFNPLMWVAYILLCRDIEMACDERVIRDLDAAGKRAYSSALLECSVSRPMIAACPLAFGEVGVKERVKSVLNYRKPAFWVILIALVLCAVVAVCFLTDPLSPSLDAIRRQDGYTILAQCDQYFGITIPDDALPEMAFSEEGHTFRDKQVIVYETDTTTIWLRHVQFANEGSEQMYFDFSISYDLPQTGTILFPYRITGESSSNTQVDVASGNLYDDDALLRTDAVSLRGRGPGQQFTLYVDTEAVREIQGAMTMYIYMNQLTYAREGKEPTLFSGRASDDVPQDMSFQASGSPAYEMGWHDRQRYTFLDPYAAFEQLTRDYAKAIVLIGQTHDLEPLTPLCYGDYKTYGWQTTADPALVEDCKAVSDFLDIYENCFLPGYEGPGREAQGSYRAGTILAQNKKLSSGYGESDLTFQVDYGHLTIFDGTGENIFDSSRFDVSFHTRKTLHEMLDQYMVAWNADGSATQSVTLDMIPEYQGLNMEILSYYADGRAEYPSYTLFYFNDELKWIATSHYYSYEQIYQVQKLPDQPMYAATYRSQACIYWPMYSSNLPGTMVMEIGVGSVRVWGEDDSFGGTYPLSGEWTDECPIPRELRLLVAALADIEPAFAIDQTRDCRYLILDETSCLVDFDGSLYLVGWRNSTKSVEIMQYIFRMVPEEQWQPMITVLAPEDPVLDKILEHNNFYVPRPHYLCVSYEPIVESNGTGPAGSYKEMYAAVRIMLMEETDAGWRESLCSTFKILLRQENSGEDKGEISVYWQSNTDDWSDRPAQLRIPVVNVYDPADCDLALAMDCWSQLIDAGLVDTDEILTRLRAEHPACFDLSTAKGLEVYWQEDENGTITCVVTPGTDTEMTEQMLEEYPELSVLETMVVIDSYGLDEGSVINSRR